MVGTFYSRANPDSEPFVKIGDRVSEETVVCIVEAMKVFNEIPAECSGKIVEILVNDQEPVDFGKPMFRVQRVSQTLVCSAASVRSVSRSSLADSYRCFKRS